MVEINQTISVPAEHLTTNSMAIVKLTCDYCTKVFDKKFGKYTKQRLVLEKDCCYDCFPEKQMELTLLKYGVTSTLQLPEIKKKSIDTNLLRYGVENSMQREEVKQKFRNTMFDRYGVEYAQQSEEIYSKSVETLYANYGVTKTIDHPEIRKKMNTWEYVNSKKVSGAQRLLASHFNGDLNIYIENKFVDILLPIDNIIIEYNGSGHYLSVSNNKITFEDFKSKEYNTLKALNDSGYKCLVIENPLEKKISKVRLKVIDAQINALRHDNNIKTIEMMIE